MDTTLYDKKENCTGCGACANVCPFDAITMTQDTEGFFYPVINNSLCKNCGKCVQISQKVHTPRGIEGQYFAVRTNDKKLLLKSTSGGAFSLIAEEIISKNGLVCGAVFDETFVVRHELSTNIEPMRKSKYVQSDIGGLYKEILAVLNKGKNVLFSGTPCQCQGVREFLLANNATCENILFVSLVCRGVASPKLWAEYTAFLSRKGKLANYDFRDKRGGDFGRIVSYSIDEKECSISMNKDPFSRIYIKSLSLRPSCYACKYCKTKLEFDFTIGDFWGIDKVKEDLADGFGVSLVIARTNEAKKIIAKISQKNEVFLVNRDDALQPALIEPANTPFLRKFLFNDLSKSAPDGRCDMELILKKYGI